ncbi:putative pentatricopeptide repeat-containing protein [Platanthera zijinensis]|uniref:Pentatricopeptide repeat-containing protein n=1 Tax=Platanthera zijinensis TaxID=2320716 RepID=A0AAP0GCZ3_9ASPA
MRISKIMARFQNTGISISSSDLLQRSSFHSTLHFNQKEEILPTNVVVRSIAYIVQKTERWDSLLKELCLASSSEITPSVAVQVLKRIKKPDAALKFFQWLDAREGFSHDSLSYSAIIKVLSKNRNPSNASTADSLLHTKIDLGMQVIRADYDLVLRQLAVVRRSDAALPLLDEMVARGFNPSVISCRALLSELFRSRREDLGWEFFARILDGKIGTPRFEIVNVAMKNLCVKRDLHGALELFMKVKAENYKPNSESFNVLIKGCCEKGEVKILCEVFKSMLDDNVKPDSYTVNLLIKELCREGKPEFGNQLFNHMRRVGWIDRKFVYAQLVDSLCDYGWWLKAFKIFVKMVRRGHHPKRDSYDNLVRRLCTGGRVNEAFEAKDLTLRKGCLPVADIHNGLIDGLCLSGRMDLVEKLLAKIDVRGSEFDSRGYNIVLRGYCLSRNAVEAAKWAERMREAGLKPDGELHDVLAACVGDRGMGDEAVEVKACVDEL